MFRVLTDRWRDGQTSDKKNYLIEMFSMFVHGHRYIIRLLFKKPFKKHVE